MRVPPLVGLLAASLITLTSLIAAPAADAARVPCVVGETSPKCKAWTAKVKFVADGDTLRPRIKQGRRWSRKRTVRLTGIQAPELSSYSRARGRRGNCMGVEATEALERLVKRRKVRLLAMRGGSTTQGSRTRLRRTIQVRRGGRWIDPAMVLLRKGLVLWFGNAKEWAWNRTYSRLAAEAAAAGRGLWNPTACGQAGPSPDAPLSLKVKWDAPGTDSAATNNGEWVRIKNGGDTPVPLRDWTLRDSHLRGDKMRSGYRFPRAAVVPAHGSVTVRVGRGIDGGGTYHWGLDEIVFDNASDDRRQLGDGAYLFDPDSELRAHVQYPCRTACSEPLEGRVSVEARYLGVEHEWVTVTNESPEPVSLDEYEIENSPWFYEFGPEDTIAPGQALTLWVRRPHAVPTATPGRRLVEPRPGLSVPGLRDFESTARFLSWSHDRGMLADGGDVVVLRNPGGAPVTGACHGWGGVRCPDA